MSKARIIIIGAGLTGLALAHKLKQQGEKALILEARPRIGGRILTKYGDAVAPIELGATWLGRKHENLTGLLDELDIKVFEQILGDKAIYEPISTSPPQVVRLPPNDIPSYRIAGGSSRLIEALAASLDPEQIVLQQEVKNISQQSDKILIETDTDTFEAQKLVSTLPPYLFSQRIAHTPALPESLMAIAAQTHTWMGDSIKVALTFAEPFWRADHLSGTIMSNVGPIPEMYDHADVLDERFALKGFLNGAYHAASKEERLAVVLRQLSKYYGEAVHDYLAYEETVWRDEKHTFEPYQSPMLPHLHNGHEVYRQSYWDGNLYIAGSETAADFPGYMDGAVQSAEYVFDQLLSS
ncbi:MAG: flavin monoamine oxidase family protein [Bacteroidia bacterium]